VHQDARDGVLRGVNESWSSSPTFTGAGTVTLTVTGGAGGQSNMTIDNGSSVSVTNPGTGSQSVAAGTHSVLAGDSGANHASGSYTITFTSPDSSSCSTATTSPSGTTQRAQNQSTAIQNGQSSLANLLGMIILQAQVQRIMGSHRDAKLITVMVTNKMEFVDSAGGHMTLEEVTFFAWVALSEFRAHARCLIPGFDGAARATGRRGACPSWN